MTSDDDIKNIKSKKQNIEIKKSSDFNDEKNNLPSTKGEEKENDMKKSQNFSTSEVIPQYADTFKKYQEYTIQSMKEMLSKYIEFQKNISSTYQSGYLQYVDEIYRSYWNNFMIPERMTETFNKVNENNNKNTADNIQISNDVIINTVEALNKTSDLMKKYTKELAEIYFNYIKSIDRATKSN
ncbi:MAG: hypothetical protein ACPKQO_01590 [Nitrososphaeraceae archaeon]